MQTVATYSANRTAGARIYATRWLMTVLGWGLKSAYPTVKMVDEMLTAGVEVPNVLLAGDANRPGLLGMVPLRAVAKRLAREKGESSPY